MHRDHTGLMGIPSFVAYHKPPSRCNEAVNKSWPDGGRAQTGTSEDLVEAGAKVGTLALRRLWAHKPGDSPSILVMCMCHSMPLETARQPVRDTVGGRHQGLG